MPKIDRRDCRYIALMPLVTMLTAGVVSALAGLVLFFNLTPPRGEGACFAFDASMVAAVVSLVSGLFTATCALAHLRPRVEDDDDQVDATRPTAC
jgi:hypothetical protein